MTNFKEELLRILDVIGYEDDKDAFVLEFERIIQLQAITDLIKDLPEDQQEVMKGKLNWASDDDKKVAEVVKDQFSEVELVESLEKATKDTVSKYIKAIVPTLSDSQRSGLLKIVEEFETEGEQDSV